MISVEDTGELAMGSVKIVLLAAQETGGGEMHGPVLHNGRWAGWIDGCGAAGVDGAIEKTKAGLWRYVMEGERLPT